MTDSKTKTRKKALQLEVDDEFEWVGEGWGDGGPRPPNRATVRDINQDTDNKEEDALVIDIVGVQGGEAEIYVYDDRSDVVLYGAAEKRERVEDIRQVSPE